MKEVENKKLCIPEYKFGVLTFETRFFELNKKTAEIVGVNRDTHLITFRWEDELYTLSAELLYNKINK